MSKKKSVHHFREPFSQMDIFSGTPCMYLYIIVTSLFFFSFFVVHGVILRLQLFLDPILQYYQRDREPEQESWRKNDFIVPSRWFLGMVQVSWAGFKYLDERSWRPLLTINPSAGGHIEPAPSRSTKNTVKKQFFFDFLKVYNILRKSQEISDL